MEVLRKNILSKFFIAFMALHLFNICIDIEDYEANGLKEDLSFNDQETIVEFVLEKILDLGDVISEHDEQDTDAEKKIDVKKIQLYYPSQIITHDQFISRKGSNFTYQFPDFCTRNFDVHSPPPELS